MASHPPVLGILGGGQLARMTAYAAFRLGLHVHIFDAHGSSPAGQIAHSETVGHVADHDALIAFGRSCDVVTLESEFVNERHLAALEAAGVAVHPGSHCLALVQDKLVQKQTLAGAGIPVAPFRAVESEQEVVAAGEELGWPLVLKSRRNGYDGYGNATLHSASEIAEGWQRITASEERRELYVEAFVPFERELATMVARSTTGEVRLYPIVDTVQRNHICHSVSAPADVPQPVALRAAELARAAVEAVGGIGVTGVEMFLLTNGDIVVNELAPRPHNSGHYTIEGCTVSQFENHVRGVMGWPLGDTGLRAPGVVMVNILGRESAAGWAGNYSEVLKNPAVHLHLYGKEQSRKGRKMGHITVLADSVGEALECAERAEATLQFDREGENV